MTKKLFLTLSAVALLSLNACATQQAHTDMDSAENKKPIEVFKTYETYFDTDSAAITEEDKAVIEDVAEAYKEEKPASLCIMGHTDTAGNPVYNKMLSEKRAQNVLKALNEAGIPKDIMMVKGQGEEALAVKTEDETYKRKNRRVEILFNRPIEK